MIFLTVGSSLPFDRLVRLIDSAVGDGLFDQEVFGQIGAGRYEPNHCRFVRFLAKHDYDDMFRKASAIVSHAGIGTISAALKTQKPILVMPRRKEHGELVDDHQTLTAERFAALGHVLAFSDRNGLEEGLRHLADFVPARRSPNVEGIACEIGSFLNQLRTEH